jgi:3',5'-cyclic AMP phosphodiesterase CpdA
MARIVQLSDIHFGGEDKAATEMALQHTIDWAPDLTLVTGDITLNGLPREFEAAAAWLERLPKPWLCTPGNHDTPYWNLILRAATPFARYRKYIGQPMGEQVMAEGVVAQTITTARGAQPRPDWSKGAINLETCRETVASLAAAPQGALRLVACHHPLIEAVGAPVTGGVHRGDEAAAILAEGGVDAILTGHLHNPFAVPLAASDGRTYAIGAGTLSVRTRGTPAGFNRLCTSDETLTVEAMGWTGSHFEPYRTWALPRRIRA